MFEKIAEMIKNLIKMTSCKETVDNRIIDVNFLGKTQSALLILPYGTHAKIPADKLVVVLSQEGNESALMGYPTDPDNQDQFDNNDLAYGIPGNVTRLIFRENDTLEIIDKAGNNVTLNSEGVILEDTNGNNYTMSSIGIDIEDLNGNTFSMSGTSVLINGNHEVLQ